MPALSSTMTEGKIITWLKSEGDKITKGESVVVVESDKADMDVESCKHLAASAGPPVFTVGHQHGHCQLYLVKLALQSRMAYLVQSLYKKVE